MDKTVKELLLRYDRPVPRYTSYPTVPYWDGSLFSEAGWKEQMLRTYTKEQGSLSLYIHLPYCESLCTFCACNKRITKNHRVEEPYIHAVIKEWKMYRALMPFRPVIQEIHLGGGTPTFFSPSNLSKLINGILHDADVAEGHAFSVEVHPNTTSFAHLEALADMGFNRISMGVQDFDPKVQYMINRIQTFERTEEVTNQARKLNYGSINFDLVYGLPGQTVNSVEQSIAQIALLQPDRIAFYSYAHVPWKSKVQRRYDEADIPPADEKWRMYREGYEHLTRAGYHAIGMDHFALENDQLTTAYRQGKLHRNFMGYTTTGNKLILGLGVSAIGDCWTAFSQNEKEVETYLDRIEKGQLPLLTGHLLTETDLLLRQSILNIMCRDETNVPVYSLPPSFVDFIFRQLKDMEADGLVQVEEQKVIVTPKGRLFVRNICSALDARLWAKSPEGQLFSRAI